MKRANQHVAVVALLALGVLACGEDPQDAVPSSIASLSQGVADGWEYAPESQRAVLRDGELTFAEYESAVLATIQCLRDEGIAIRREPSIDKTGWRITFSWSAGPDLATVDRTYKTFTACHDENQNYIEYVWAAMHEPTEVERQAAEAALGVCLGETTPETPPPFNSAEFFPWLDRNGLFPAFEVCVEEVHVATGVLLGSE